MSEKPQNENPPLANPGNDLSGSKPIPRIITLNTPSRKPQSFTLIQQPANAAPVLQFQPRAAVTRFPHVPKLHPRGPAHPSKAPSAPESRLPPPPAGAAPTPIASQTTPLSSLSLPGVNKPPARRVFQSTAPLNIILPRGGKAVGRPAPKPAALRPPGKARFAQKKADPKWLCNRYRIKEKLGDGGTGTVYRADDEFLDNPVAIKVLNPDLTFDKDAIATLKDEARIAMRLAHQHIVHLHNLEKSGSSYFLVMEYIEGNTLRDQLHVFGYFTIDTVTQILGVCSDALTYAHRHGVLHNDLKLENLMLTQEGVLKIIDFGIACLINTRQAGYIMGTPDYMSPEQIRGEELDVRTDEYSLGIMAYELITGRTPFAPKSSFQDILAAVPARFPNAPQPFKPILERATAPIREDRYDTVAEFVKAFTTAAGPLIVKETQAEEAPGTDSNGRPNISFPPQIRA